MFFLSIFKKHQRAAAVLLLELPLHICPSTEIAAMSLCLLSFGAAAMPMFPPAPARLDYWPIQGGGDHSTTGEAASGSSGIIRVSAWLPSGRAFFSGPLLVGEAELQALPTFAALESFILGEAEKKDLVVAECRGPGPRLQNNHWAPNAGLLKDAEVVANLLGSFGEEPHVFKTGTLKSGDQLVRFVREKMQASLVGGAAAAPYHDLSFLSPAVGHDPYVASYLGSQSQCGLAPPDVTVSLLSSPTSPEHYHCGPEVRFSGPEVRFTVVTSLPPLESTATRRSLPGAVIRISQGRLAELFRQNTTQFFFIALGRGNKVLRGKVEARVSDVIPANAPLPHPSSDFLGAPSSDNYSDSFYTYDLFEHGPSTTCSAGHGRGMHVCRTSTPEQVCAVQFYVAVGEKDGDDDSGVASPSDSSDESGLDDDEWRRQEEDLVVGNTTKVELSAFPELREFALRVAGGKIAAPPLQGWRFQFGDRDSTRKPLTVPDEEGSKKDRIKPKLLPDLMADLFPPVDEATVENYRFTPGMGSDCDAEAHGHDHEHDAQRWERIPTGGVGGDIGSKFVFGGERKWSPQWLGKRLRLNRVPVSFYVRRRQLDEQGVEQQSESSSLKVDGETNNQADSVQEHRSDFSLVLKLRLRSEDSSGNSDSMMLSVEFREFVGMNVPESGEEDEEVLAPYGYTIHAPVLQVHPCPYHDGDGNRIRKWNSFCCCRNRLTSCRAGERAGAGRGQHAFVLQRGLFF